MRQKSLWEASRQTLPDALSETAELLREYGPRYKRWGVAYSGGKDSTAMLTAILYLIDAGEIAPPESLVVMYADTRMELPPLHATAQTMLARLRDDGYDARTILPALDERFFVYMFGRGVPPPSNTFRWCTDQLKIEPMALALRALGAGEKTLVLTGVRIGESARRDDSIAAACSRDGAECGQGRIHLAMAGAKDNDINRYFIPGTDSRPADTLAPLLHWRVCHVWEWLLGEHTDCPEHEYLPLTRTVATAYGDGGGSKLIESAARTGCVGCNLASHDVALERLLKRPEWKHLQPLTRLRGMYAVLKYPRNRLRKPGGETRKDGSLCANQNRMGPLTFDARQWGLAYVKTIQDEVCKAAATVGQPPYNLISPEEEQRILALIHAKTWPDGWRGDEPRADEDFEEWRSDGTRQPSLFGMEGQS